MNAPASSESVVPLWVGLTHHTVNLIEREGAEAVLLDATTPEAVRGRPVILAPSAAKPGQEIHAERRLRGMGASVSTIPPNLLRGSLDLASMIEDAATDGKQINLPLMAALVIEKARASVQPVGGSGPVRGRIVALNIDELLMRQFPPMEPLLAPWLCKQHLSMVHAWRGVGKTHFALGVAYAVAGGGKFLKWKAEKPWRVVYIDGEMAGAAIKARVAAIVESTPDENEPPEGYFRIITPDAQHLPLPDLSSLEGQAALALHIADTDLIVVDNLSSLMRSGAENDAESWVPVADWALALRRQGKAVLFVHHDGKGKTQRGTSKKEDVMDVVIKLDHTKDYEAEKGAAFTVEFEKARHLSGEDARNLEAALTKDEQGRQAWAWKAAELGMSERVLALHAEAPDMTQTEIAAELGCNRSTVSRALNSAREQGAGGLR